jgi:hypothetical protein
MIETDGSLRARLVKQIMRGCGEDTEVEIT